MSNILAVASKTDQTRHSRDHRGSGSDSLIAFAARFVSAGIKIVRDGSQPFGGATRRVSGQP
ncbi:hypothetical protein QF002_004956 [Paraburkholderia youngii]